MKELWAAKQEAEEMDPPAPKQCLKCSKEIYDNHIMCWQHWKETPDDERLELLKKHGIIKPQRRGVPNNLIGNGETHYEHGNLVYCDDGNGQVWDYHEELNDDDW